MFQNNYGDAIIGVGCLIAAIYNGSSSYNFFSKAMRYRNSVAVCESFSNKEPVDADEYLSDYKGQSEKAEPVLLTGV